jgi:hypothetical protein
MDKQKEMAALEANPFDVSRKRRATSMSRFDAVGATDHEEPDQV